MNTKKRLIYLGVIYITFIVAFLILFLVSKVPFLLYVTGIFYLFCLLATITMLIRNIKVWISLKKFLFVDVLFLAAYLFSIWLFVYSIFMWILVNILLGN